MLELILVPIKKAYAEVKSEYDKHGHDFKESDFWEFVKECKKEEAH